MKYPAYPEYKESGVEWLGDIPAHWCISRLKQSTTGCINGVWGDEPNEIDDLICIRVADFDRETFTVIDNPKTIRAIAPSQRKTRLLKAHDLLLEKSGGGEKQLVGCVVEYQSSQEAVCSNFVARLPVARGYSSRFLSYLHASIYAGRLNYPSIKQTTGIQNLDSGEYLNIPAAFPPLDEQQTIARFLDAKTAKVDCLIAKNRDLIEKLKEKRSALIACTVTQGLPPEAALAAGLDPHPKMKDSGVDWLGQIPEHWDIEKFSREVQITEGQVDPEVEPYLSMPLIAPNHIESGIGRLITIETAADQFAESGKYLCKAGYVIYSKIRPALQKAVIAPSDCLCSADMYPMNCRKKMVNHYLLWLLLSSPFTGWSVLEADRVAMPKINRETLSQLRLPVPPLEEQHAIVRFLEVETLKLDTFIGKIESAHLRLQEYRQALITAAVTGKIDIREAA